MTLTKTEVFILTPIELQMLILSSLKQRYHYLYETENYQCAQIITITSSHLTFAESLVLKKFLKEGTPEEETSRYGIVPILLKEMVNRQTIPLGTYIINDESQETDPVDEK